MADTEFDIANHEWEDDRLRIYFEHMDEINKGVVIDSFMGSHDNWEDFLFECRESDRVECADLFLRAMLLSKNPKQLLAMLDKQYVEAMLAFYDTASLLISGAQGVYAVLVDPVLLAPEYHGALRTYNQRLCKKMRNHNGQ